MADTRKPWQEPQVRSIDDLSLAYGAPCTPFGSAPTGQGGKCQSGGTASGEKCSNGTTASGQKCQTGGTALNGACESGGTAGGQCNTGTSGRR